MTILKRTGSSILDEVTEGRCTECRCRIRQESFGPEIGHAEDCAWTMHDGDDRTAQPSPEGDLDYNATLALALMPDLTDANAKQVGALIADRLALKARVAELEAAACARLREFDEATADNIESQAYNGLARGHAPRVDDKTSSTREAVVEIVGMIDARIERCAVEKRTPGYDPERVVCASNELVDLAKEIDEWWTKRIESQNASADTFVTSTPAPVSVKSTDANAAASTPSATNEPRSSDAPAVIVRATSTEADVQAAIRDAVSSGRGLTITENGITRMQIAARRPVQVCTSCNDTHRWPSGNMCTACPRPCEKCRGKNDLGNRTGPYCDETPCSCECHAHHTQYAARRERVPRPSEAICTCGGGLGHKPGCPGLAAEVPDLVSRPNDAHVESQPVMAGEKGFV